MANFKLFPFVIAAAIFTIAQSAGAVGLPNVPNTHHNDHHKLYPNNTNLADAFWGGKSDLWIRLRFEDVEDDFSTGHPLDSTENADAMVGRIAIGYTTGRYYGFYARLEGEFNRVLGEDRAFNLDDDFRIPPNTPPGGLAAVPAGLKPPKAGPPPNVPAINRFTEGHAIIPDNNFEEINEAYIGWRSSTGGCPNAPGPCDGTFSFKLGRQTIIYDNHRWVGDVVWRQNNVSFDALRVDKSFRNLGVSYSYINKVNRPFGEDSIFNEWKMDDSHLINVSYKFPEVGKLVAYAYLLDFDNNPRTPFEEGTGMAPYFVGPVIFDSDTYGLRWTSKHQIGDAFKLLTEFEWANQDPGDDANSRLDDNDYYNIEVGGAFKIARKPVVVKIGHEVLESNGRNALQTPLATIHAFNGWADKFVAAPGGTTTPLGGIEDTSVTVVVKGVLSSLIGPSKLVFQYHDFSTDRTYNAGGNRISDYGDEWGVLFAKPFNKKLLGLLKYADFDSEDGFSSDTQKFWAMLQYRWK